MIHFWQFESGSSAHRISRGWYCWACPNDHEEFEKWMDRCCPGAEYTRRVNSDHVIYTVYIKDEKEAFLFQMKFSE